MLKWIVGAAGLAVIAYVGYFFWGEAQKAEVARIEAETLKLQQAAEVAAARSECLSLRDDMRVVLEGGTLGRRFIQVDAKVALRRCVADGLLQLDDIEGINLET